MNPTAPLLPCALRGLYVVTDARAPGGHIAMARAALEGGAKIIQLRDKNATSSELIHCGKTLRALTRRHNALLVINDNIELARHCEADGIHLGPDDMPVSQARVLLPHSIIGASCGTLVEAENALQDGATYIGVGAVFGTQTKLDAGAAIGLQTLREIIASTPLPVAAIGGISLDNINDVVRCGSQMACVVSAISGQPNEDAMKQATCELVAAANFSAN